MFPLQKAPSVRPPNRLLSSECRAGCVSKGLAWILDELCPIIWKMDRQNKGPPRQKCHNICQQKLGMIFRINGHQWAGLRLLFFRANNSPKFLKIPPSLHQFWHRSHPGNACFDPMTSGYGGYGVMVGDNGNPIPQSIPNPKAFYNHNIYPNRM